MYVREMRITLFFAKCSPTFDTAADDDMDGCGGERQASKQSIHGCSRVITPSLKAKAKLVHLRVECRP